MPPSESMNRSFGCRCSTPEKSRSTVDHHRLDENTAIATANGAFGATTLGSMNEKPGTKLPDPKCRHTGRTASSKAAHRGPQGVGWGKDGRPSGPRPPRAASALGPL